MIRSLRFTDASDRELTVAETDGYDGVEIRVGGLPFTFDREAWLAFAKLAASTLERYGEPQLTVNLGRKCGDCESTGLVAAEGGTDVPCLTCSGRGFLAGPPEDRPRKRAVT